MGLRGHCAASSALCADTSKQRTLYVTCGYLSGSSRTERGMATNDTSPGVHVPARALGPHTIPGASTSATAFVDFFARGPLDDPVRVTSFADFERAFGGLDPRSAASYAIQQYFLNGGAIAHVVRVAERDQAGLPVAAAASLTPTGGALRLDAGSPRAWANSRIRVGAPPGADVRAPFRARRRARRASSSATARRPPRATSTPALSTSSSASRRSSRPNSSCSRSGRSRDSFTPDRRRPGEW